MLLRSLLVLVSALLLTPAAHAEQEAAAKKPCLEFDCPVAKRGTAVITVADVTAKVRQLDPKVQSALMSDPKQINKMLENLLILRQIANEVDMAAAAKDPLLQARLKQAAEEVLVVYRLDQVRAARVTGDFEQLAHESYLTNMASMKSPRQVAVRHLLVDSRKYGEEAALARATDLAKRVEGGDQKQFEALVLEASDDPSKAENAGLFTVSEATKDIDQGFLEGALALTKVGQISAPVHSQFGYHLIQLVEETPARVIPFEEARSAIITKLKEDAEARVTVEYRTEVSMSGELEFSPENLEGLLLEDIPED